MVKIFEYMFKFTFFLELQCLIIEYISPILNITSSPFLSDQRHKERVVQETVVIATQNGRVSQPRTPIESIERVFNDNTFYGFKKISLTAQR